MMRIALVLSALLLILPLNLQAFHSPTRTLSTTNGRLATSVQIELYPSQSKLKLPPLSMTNIQMSHANLAVSIDQPLLPSIPRSLFMTSLLKIIVSDIFKAAVVAFLMAFSLSVLVRTPAIQIQSTNIWKFVSEIPTRLREWVRPSKEGVPMTFEDNDGWGVCTLRGKKIFGKTSFVQYDFDLPKSDYVLPLKLGQQVNFCCLDENGNVAKGDFYTYYSGKQKLGSFSILAPDRTVDETQFAIGTDSANFVRVLKKDMKIGDEVALRPGAQMLEYRGSHFPVTDMVYIACGVGIVPILDQIRAVLPNGSSSVKSVTVVWINEDTSDFDLTAEQLEKEYMKYSTKLAVSCVVDNLRTNTVEDNREVAGAVPAFSPGTMAVLSGPKEVSRKTASYLIKRGYPEDCICVL